MFQGGLERLARSLWLHALHSHHAYRTVPYRTQALAYFEAAKEANEQGDFSAACSYFETSYLMTPKMSTASMVT